jgi:hypothetical protein
MASHDDIFDQYIADSLQSGTGITLMHRQRARESLLMQAARQTQLNVEPPHLSQRLFSAAKAVWRWWMDLNLDEKQYAYARRSRYMFKSYGVLRDINMHFGYPAHVNFAGLLL